MTPPAPENGFQSAHANLIIESFQRVIGRTLCDMATPETLYTMDRIVLSHNGAADPILTYGNRAAQRLWQMDWAALTALPSRLTAEPTERAERDAMFAQMRAKGFIDTYSGIRISATGTRFEIRNAIIWPLLDTAGTKHGEAATFVEYAFV